MVNNTRRAVKFCFSIRLQTVGNIHSQSEGIARTIRKLQRELDLHFDGNVFPGLSTDHGEVLFEGRIRPRSWWRRALPFALGFPRWIADMRSLREALQREENVGRVRVTYHWVTEVL
jgi:hypothetical protein